MPNQRLPAGDRRMSPMNHPDPPTLLQTPFELAGRRLRNRIVHVSMTTLRAKNGGTTASQIQYYENRARGIDQLRSSGSAEGAIALTCRPTLCRARPGSWICPSSRQS